MTAIAVDCLILLFAGVCLYGAELSRPVLHAIHPDYLSGENGRSLRGILSLGILFHHLGQKGMGCILLPLFSKVGFLLVSVFFFLSGFGLMKQHMAREDYRRQFLRRRMPTILIPYLVSTALYWLLYALLGTPWTLGDILRGILRGSPIVTASWYVICILLFYLAFWCLMWLCGKRYSLLLIGATGFLGCYLALCRKLGYGSWWFNTAPVLLLGMIWALYQEKIDLFLKRHIHQALPVTALAFLVVYGSKILLNSRLSGFLLPTALTWLVCYLFVTLLLLILSQLSLGNSLLRRLGDISLETYLCQFFFLQLLRSNLVNVENDLLYALLVLVETLLCAQVLHKLDRALIRLCVREGIR